MGTKIVLTESGEPAFRIEDEEAVIRTLPECEVADLPLDSAMTVQLTCYPATMRLPLADRAIPIEVPEPKWQGWEWQSGESILLLVDDYPGLPRLVGITIPDHRMCRITVAGRPMRVRRHAPGDPEWANTGYSAEVRGFLNDFTEFWAQVIAPSVDGRETLLAAVSTLHPVTQ